MNAHRLFAASLLIAAVTASNLAPAGAATFFDTGDREELIGIMQEAANAQDLCYSWRLVVVDHGGSESGTDTKTITPEPAFRGTGTDRQDTGCRRTIGFLANVTYTSESSESEDSASWNVYGVAAANVKVNTSRLISDPGTELAAVMPQLPMAATEAGMAPAVPIEANTAELQADEHLTGDPGSDWLRNNGALLAVLTIGLLGAAALAASTLFNRKRSSEPAVSDPTPEDAGDTDKTTTDQTPPEGESHDR